MTLRVITGPVIEQGEALSDPIDVSGGALVRLTMPAEWLSAPLTFQISSDGEGYNDMYDFQGEEVAIPVQPGVGIVIPRDALAGVGFIRFRSGTSSQEVAQPERREFSVALLVEAASPVTAKVTKTTKQKSKPKKKKKKSKPQWTLR
jgi:hypothetical protein